MQSRYVQSRGNIFVFSSREQFTSSVASHLVSPLLPESSPGSSVLLLPNCVQKGSDSHLLGRSSLDSSSERHIVQDFPLCVETFVQPGFRSETGEMLSGTNSSLSLSGCVSRHNLHVSCPARGNRSPGYREHARKC